MHPPPIFKYAVQLMESTFHTEERSLLQRAEAHLEPECRRYAARYVLSLLAFDFCSDESVALFSQD